MFKTLIKIPRFLLKEHKINLFFFIIFSLFIPIFESIGVASLGAVILFVLDIENFINLIPGETNRSILTGMDKKQLIFYSSLLFVIILTIKNLFILLYFFFEGNFKRQIGNYHSELLFRKFIDQNYIDLITYNLSNIQNEILVQAKKISGLIFLTAGFVKDIILALIFIITLFLMNFKATLFLLALSLIISVSFFYLTSKKIKLIGGRIRLLEGELVKIVRSTFEGFKIIILFGKKYFFSSKFSNALSEMTKHELWYFVLSKIPRLMFEMIFAVSLVAFLNIFVLQELDINEVLPYLVFLSLITMRMLPIFTNINLIIAQMKIHQIAVEKIIDLLLQTSKSPNSKKIMYKKEEKENLFKKIENLNLIKINFKFPKSNNKILNDFSYSFDTNKLYALAGRSGTGKSTLVDLITGMLEPDSGQVLSGRISIFENLKSWQNKVGYVPQENFLINDTVKKNICFGEDEEKIDNKRLNDAINQSDLRDFINNLPKQENTEIADRGINISGGQRQRIGLARALYQNRNVLLLDEATSSVDTETEEAILKTLHKIKKDRIIIMIAHRQSTIEKCDQIINLEKLK